MQFLGTSDKKKQGRPVRLHLYDGEVQMLGILTQSQPDFLPGTESKVTVYLPVSYQIGGYTLFVPADYVEELPDMTMEEVLKLTITAGVGRGADTEESAS